MPKKDDRLQLRMDPALKEWFREDAAPEGGMSNVVHHHVEDRYQSKTGKIWSADGNVEAGTGVGEGTDSIPEGASPPGGGTASVPRG